MISRREFLQATAAAGALVSTSAWARWGARPRSRDCPGRHPALRSAGAGDDPVSGRHPRPAGAAAFPRALGQSRRGRGEGPAAASDGCRVPGPFQHGRRFARGVCPDIRRFRPARPQLWQDRQARPHRHVGQGCARRARRGRGAAARRRRHLAGRLERAPDQGPGHGRRHVGAEARRHDLALGIHARRRAGEGDRRGGPLRLPSAEHPRQGMERAGLPAAQAVRRAASRSPSSARRCRAPPSPIRAG
ncbi:hypothetical protein BTHI11S_04490 [Bosea thiooxidans]